ncbi:unnamed protein product [Ascophyllum nodosum]
MDRIRQTRRHEVGSRVEQLQRRGKIQARRREERWSVRPSKRSVGFGPDGLLPAYTLIYPGSVEASLFALPAFVGRGQHTSARSPSLGRHGLLERPQSSSYVGRREALDSRAKLRIPRRPATAVRTHTAVKFDAGLDGYSGDHETAPGALRRRRRISPGRELRRCGPASAKREKVLLKKLANLLRCRRNGGKCPTVAALRTAVAIEALHEQLRECRGDKAAAVGLQAQSHARTRSASKVLCGSRRKSVKSRTGIEPWDASSPSTCKQVSSPASSLVRTRLTSAQVLRKLTCNNSVFKDTENPPCRHPAGLRPKEMEATALLETTAAASRSSGEKGSTDNEVGLVAHASNEAALASSAVEDEMRDCFRRLTAGALIELNHLPSPPRPVRAVMTALACVLGWKRNLSGHSLPHSLFSNAYALRDVLASIHPQRISSRRLLALTKLLGVDDAATARVKRASVSAGVLLDWLLAVVACAKVGADEGYKPGARQSFDTKGVFGTTPPNSSSGGEKLPKKETGVSFVIPLRD